MTETEKKEKKRISLKIKWPPIKRPHFSFKAWKTKIFWKRFALVCLVLMVLGGGVAIGTLKAILQNLPSIQALETFEPPITTYIYADNGEVIGQFATERRVEVLIFLESCELSEKIYALFGVQAGSMVEAPSVSS